MIAIGAGVGALAATSPALLQRTFGIPAADITGAGGLGWRLFAARNLHLGARAARGDAGAIAAFGPLQALDQVVFRHAFAARSVPRSTSLLAASASLVIVALDAHRRAGG